jgi:SAM-dependent MidA family methyltransferase
VVQREAGLREIYVGARSGQLIEVEGEPCTLELARYLERFGAPLEAGQLAEVNLEVLAWLERATAALERGFLLTVDYGHRARELYGPGHPRGTQLAYRGHRASEDWLASPGEQDMTAHVNFTALEERGRELGVETVGYTTQASFLLALARASGFAGLAPAGAGEREQHDWRQQLKQLVHPEAMGEAFKVLAQAKGVQPGALTGFEAL